MLNLDQTSKRRVNWFSSLSNKYRSIIIDKIQENQINLDGDNYYQILIKGKLLPLIG
jgi:hypothetical protein